MSGYLFQHGTLALLVPGLYEGTASVQELLDHGDLGLGTLTGLNGEVMIIDHHAYHMNGAGKLTLLTGQEQVPFANSNHFVPEVTYEVTNQDSAALEAEMLEKIGSTNGFIAVKVTGDFSELTTRAIDQQQPPYRPLADLAAEQHVFKRNQASGEMMGYFTPKLFQGVGSAGFHLHFVDQTRQFGGHLLHYHIKKARVELQLLDKLDLHLPLDHAEFKAFDFENGLDLDAAISAAEH